MGEDLERYTLAFDACSKQISFCLWEGTNLCFRWSAAEREEGLAEVLAEDLPFLLAEELAKRGRELSQKSSEVFSYRMLRRLCFVRGPGSYTGLRACLSVARGFRLACGGLELCSLTSFEAGLLAADEKMGEGYVLSLVESFRGVWYGQAFRGGDAMGDARILGEDALRLWVFELREEAGGEMLGLCGGGVERALGVLESFPKGSFLVGGVGDAYDFSRPLVAGEGARYARGEEALQPIYMGAPV